MHPLSSLVLLGAYAAQVVLGRPNSHQTTAIRSGSDVDTFITKQRPIALSGLLRNIGPDGAYAPGVAPGVVVASPTTVNPDCESHRSLANLCIEASRQHLVTKYGDRH